jgi:hypothetical protein
MPWRALSADVSGSQRRSTFALAALAALAVLIGGFVIASPDRTPQTTHGPTATQPPAWDSPPTSSGPAPKRPARRTDALGTAAARATARRFLTDYLRLVRGRHSTRTLSDAAPELRRDLRRHPARPTPTQQLRPATIRAVEVTLQGPDSVRAIATLQAAGSPPYPLLLYLERRGTHWVVARIGDA